MGPLEGWECACTCVCVCVGSSCPGGCNNKAWRTRLRGGEDGRRTTWETRGGEKRWRRGEKESDVERRWKAGSTFKEFQEGITNAATFHVQVLDRDHLKEYLKYLSCFCQIFKLTQAHTGCHSDYNSLLLPRQTLAHHLQKSLYCLLFSVFTATWLWRPS